MSVKGKQARQSDLIIASEDKKQWPKLKIESKNVITGRKRNKNLGGYKKRDLDSYFSQQRGWSASQTDEEEVKAPGAESCWLRE